MTDLLLAESPRSLVEESLLRQLVGHPTVAPRVALDAGVREEHFTDRGLRSMFAAVVTIVGRGEAPDAEAVQAELGTKAWGRLSDSHHNIVIGARNTASPAEQAEAITRTRSGELLRRARQDRAAGLIGDLSLAMNGADDPGRASALLEELARVNREGPVALAADRLLDGPALLDDDVVPAVSCLWGSGEQVGWAAGESLFIVGPQGVGKSTLAQQLALARAEVAPPNLLGMPVGAAEKPVLYVAADRPSQSIRSLRRMITETDREALARLKVWKGPLPFLLTDRPSALTDFALALGVGTVVIDSLKDAAVKLADDETGGRINLAFQTALAAGLELVVVHHQRKGAADNKRPDKLDDVYGSTFITAGSGSVLLLWGQPGDPIVDLRHLKQPAEEIGPYSIVHDHARGRTTLHEPPDLLSLVQAARSQGVTVGEAAEALFGSDGRSEHEKARRRLVKLADQGQLLRIPADTILDADRYIYNGPAEP